MNLLTLNTLELILLVTFVALFIVQIGYHWGLYSRIYFRYRAVNNNKLKFETDFPPLSVVICAKNESENLKRYLPSILEQDYPQFEVIVVNDGSTDESDDILTRMEEEYPHLYHTFTPETARYISRKKLSLTIGIKASKYDWLVFTEANCRPSSPDWLKLMARNFTSSTDVVLGYSGYESAKGWLQQETTFDSFFNAMRYLSFALLNKPFMGIGRNMAYRKELFFKNKGFSAHLNLQKGDDDLFINKIATRSNTRVETDKKASILIRSMEYAKDWTEEKVSYVVTSHYFKGIQKYLLGFETLTRLAFYGLFIALLILSIIGNEWILLSIVSLLFILRYVSQTLLFNKTATTLHEKHYYLMLPVFDIVQPLYNFKFKLYQLLRHKEDFMRR